MRKMTMSREYLSSYPKVIGVDGKIIKHACHVVELNSGFSMNAVGDTDEEAKIMAIKLINDILKVKKHT
jgi:hypothetical protein